MHNKNVIDNNHHIKDNDPSLKKTKARVENGDSSTIDENDNSDKKKRIMVASPQFP